jgi:HSP20 family molecular chaperone IbpA
MNVKQQDTAATSTLQSDPPSPPNSSQPAGRDETQRQRQESQLSRRNAIPFLTPFALLQGFLTADIADILDQPGTRDGKPKVRARSAGDLLTWSPRVDVVQRGNEVVVRADLPGVDPDNVTVDVTDDAIVLSGQRQEERVENGGSVYRVERAYGAFYREIPLPEGAIVDQASASFRDGVLEISVPAPPAQVSRGRRLEITK